MKVALGELLVAFDESVGPRRLEAIKGIGAVSAISIVARIGPVKRFRNAEALIAFAGLAPGIRESDQTRRNGRIGGEDSFASTSLRDRGHSVGTFYTEVQEGIRPYHERRGSKIGHLVVARMMLRSIYKILKAGVDFVAGAPAPPRRSPPVPELK